MKASMQNRSGQSTVEYAITIVLVSMVVITIMLFAGFGISRIYGLVAGALGAHYDTHPQSAKWLTQRRTSIDRHSRPGVDY